MGLETGSYIAELNATNPAGSDAVSSGDDHIRLLKTCVTGSFGAFVGTAASPASVTLTEAQINDAALKSAGNTFSGANGFAAITATTYDGIAAADLVDKSAAETVTGAWNFSTAPQVASLEVGHATDTTLTRSAAGMLEVEGRPLISHNDAALGSGEIYVSTSAPSGGSDGDIWLEREA